MTSQRACAIAQVPIFQYNYWWLVILYGCFMLLVGAYEAVSRPAYTYTVR